MNDNISDLPVQGLVIDLDATEREDSKPPFKAMVGGRVITMIDPQELDWRELLMMKDPREFLRLAVAPEDREHLNKQPMPGWKFGKLMESYYAHFDLEELAANARREQALSGGLQGI